MISNWSCQTVWSLKQPGSGNLATWLSCSSLFCFNYSLCNKKGSKVFDFQAQQCGLPLALHIIILHIKTLNVEYGYAAFWRTTNKTVLNISIESDDNYLFSMWEFILKELGLIILQRYVVNLAKSTPFLPVEDKGRQCWYDWWKDIYKHQTT